MMSQEFSFKLSFENFDRSLLADSSVALSSFEFQQQVTEFFAKQFAGFGGKARVVVDDSNQVIDVRWTKEAAWKDPHELALELVAAGNVAEALPILRTLYHQQPSAPSTLYHLGLAYSEVGLPDRAIPLLEQLVEIAPDRVLGMVALAAAEIGMGNLLIGEQWLRKALEQEPGNYFALRNLAATLLKQGRFAESLEPTQKCIDINTGDTAMLVAKGEALAALGQLKEAEDCYRAATRSDGPESLIDLAKERLTQRSGEVLRSSTPLRLDVLTYFQDAFERFSRMSLPEIKSLAMEIAMLGKQGLDINNPETKHELRAFPGRFTGLHLVSLMYAAFQEFAPQQDLGIDLSREYKLAKDVEQ